VPAPNLDVICIGRSSVDLYGLPVGGGWEDMASFSKAVGGCPTNIAVGTARLGLKSGLITRVGDEPPALRFSLWSAKGGKRPYEGLHWKDRRARERGPTGPGGSSLGSWADSTATGVVSPVAR
jgi:hypothetical protein